MHPELPLPANFDAKPAGVWDPGDNGNIWWVIGRPGWDWAAEHIRDANRTRRVEFYLLDMPFAVLYRCTFTGGPVIEEEPVIQLLDELPPAWMLSEHEFFKHSILEIMNA